MELVHVPKKNIVGLSVRTNNAAELESASPKIVPLWGKFFSRIGEHIPDGALIYGVYHQYESDFSGKYTLLAGADSVNNIENLKLNQVTIAEGSYLLFSAKGKMPHIVFQLWDDVERYFSAEDCKYQRAYTTDFELYKDTRAVDLYIQVLHKNAQLR